MFSPNWWGSPAKARRSGNPYSMPDRCRRRLVQLPPPREERDPESSFPHLLLLPLALPLGRFLSARTRRATAGSGSATPIRNSSSGTSYCGRRDRHRRGHARRLLSPRAGPLRAARRGPPVLAAGRPMARAAEPKRHHVGKRCSAAACRRASGFAGLAAVGAPTTHESSQARRREPFLAGLPGRECRRAHGAGITCSAPARRWGKIVIGASARGRLSSPRPGPLRAGRRDRRSHPGARRRAADREGTGPKRHHVTTRL
jgi:hypothetical protein